MLALVRIDATLSHAALDLGDGVVPGLLDVVALGEEAHDVVVVVGQELAVAAREPAGLDVADVVETIIIQNTLLALVHPVEQRGCGTKLRSYSVLNFLSILFLLAVVNRLCFL